MTSVDAIPVGLAEADKREPILDTIDRVSEMCFGLFMALSFVGVVSIATGDEDPGRALMSAAFGCNLAWGLVDAVMYILRSVVARSRRQALALSVQNAPDIAAAIGLLRDALPRHLQTLVGDAELEAIRSRVMGVDFHEQPKLRRDDFVGALGIFLIVVLSTFPVALPFVLVSDPSTALVVSRVLTLVMLFAGGMALGIHAGYGGWKAGLGMVGLGVCLTAAIIALGG